MTARERTTRASSRTTVVRTAAKFPTSPTSPSCSLRSPYREPSSSAGPRFSCGGSPSTSPNRTSTAWRCSGASGRRGRVAPSAARRGALAPRADRPRISSAASQGQSCRAVALREGVPSRATSRSTRFRLSDYIHDAQSYGSGPPAERMPNSVAYNPAKGKAYICGSPAMTPGISWHPLHGMTPDQVEALLRRVEVYIDLGHHPGKDRIPREAALAGCVVVVGARGSAAFPEDVPVQHEVRIEVNDVTEPPGERHTSLRTSCLTPSRGDVDRTATGTTFAGRRGVFRREVQAGCSSTAEDYSRPSENAASRSWRE